MAANIGRLRWTWQEDVADPGWIDDNGHLNVAFYALIFDHALDAALAALDLGAAYRMASGCSVFVLDTHTRFHAEVLAGSTVSVGSCLLDADRKRLLFHHQMRIAPSVALVAAQEAVCIHVDLTSRRSRSWPTAAHDRLLAHIGSNGAEPPPAARRTRLEDRR